MTSTITRLYAVGENALDLFADTRSCDQPHSDGYRCSLERGHGGPQHIAMYGGGQVCAVWDNEPAMSDVDELKQRIRTLVPTIVRHRGYGHFDQWNVTLKRLGIEPITERTVRIVAPARTAVRSGFDTEQQAHDYLEARRANLAEFLVLDREAVDADAATVEVVEDTPLAEDEDATEDPRASSDDLEAFRALVIEEAGRLQRTYSWCDEGVDGVLREVGISRSREYRVEVSVTARQTVWIDVTASSEDAAREQIDTSEVRANIDRYEWSFDYDDWEIQDVTEN